MLAAAGLQPDLVAAGLPAGWSLRYAESVTSTQDMARAAARAGAPDRTICLADHQTAGRGRRGRHWLASPGSALTFSILFRAGEPRPQRYTMLVSLALVDAIRELAPGLEPRIKWPNDVMLGERKVAGVLAEAEWHGDALLLVVGAGVNVTTSPAQLAGVGQAATSLLVASGRAVAREALLLAVVRQLDRRWDRSPHELHLEWAGRLWGLGQRLPLVDGGVREDVVVLGVEEDGRLRVRLPDGSERRTATGELIL
jgi:BirA family transcriptional regulator, biotin operon repressor / biotin---[acetyl-CoA-carboxylase] ligase